MPIKEILGDRVMIQPSTAPRTKGADPISRGASIQEDEAKWLTQIR
jgi:hypothetical protein